MYKNFSKVNLLVDIPNGYIESDLKWSEYAISEFVSV